jgi:cell division initiation protein
MNFTPMDIKRQTFKKAMRGYDADEVSHFLEMVAARFDEILKEKNELAERTDRLKFEVNRYEKLEKTIQETLINSQRTLEETRAQAEQEAGLIIKDAEIKAEQIKFEAQKDKEEIKRELIALAEQKKLFTAKLHGLIQSHLEMLKATETEPEPGERSTRVLRSARTGPAEPAQAANNNGAQANGKNFSSTI